MSEHHTDLRLRSALGPRAEANAAAFTARSANALARCACGPSMSSGPRSGS